MPDVPSPCPPEERAELIAAARADPQSVRTHLEGGGLDSRPPPVAPARRPPQTDLEFAA